VLLCLGARTHARRRTRAHTRAHAHTRAPVVQEGGTRVRTAGGSFGGTPASHVARSVVLVKSVKKMRFSHFRRTTSPRRSTRSLPSGPAGLLPRHKTAITPTTFCITDVHVRTHTHTRTYTHALVHAHTHTRTRTRAHAPHEMSAERSVGSSFCAQYICIVCSPRCGLMTALKRGVAAGGVRWGSGLGTCACLRGSLRGWVWVRACGVGFGFGYVCVPAGLGLGTCACLRGRAGSAEPRTVLFTRRGARC
jgi:hypothetical protein